MEPNVEPSPTAQSLADGLALPEAYQPGHNGVLRLYNMFPRNYADFDAMTADLPRIAAMGFSHVWLNPLHDATSVEKKKWPEGTPNGLKGSLYSMRDPFAFNEAFSTVKGDERANLTPDQIAEKDKEAIRRFTNKARELGLVPMFDLVLSHLAPDSAVVDGTHPKFQQASTQGWFDRYDNGQPKRHGLDQDGNILPSVQYPDKEVWDDVVMLKYDDPAIRADIIARLWKPFIDQYLDLGFMGVRVDSVANNHPDVMGPVLEHFRDEYAKKHGGVEPTVLGESLGGTVENQSNIRPHATHMYNSAFWLPQWQAEPSWFGLETSLKQRIVFQDPATGNIKDRKGGTVGFAGSHDELPWLLNYPKDRAPLTHEEVEAELFRKGKVDYEIDVPAAERSLREKMANAALMSDGGWFLSSFDEKLDTTLRTVFDKHTPGQQLGNLEDFVADINRILKAMPQTKYGSWSKRYFDEKQPDLVIIERHTGPEFTGPGHLVVMSTSPDQDITLTGEDIRRIAAITSRSSDDFFHEGEPGQTVWFGGKIQTPTLAQTLAATPPSFSDRIELSRTGSQSRAI